MNEQEKNVTDAETTPADMNVENTPAPQEYILTQDEKTFGMLCHLSALAGLFFPFGNFLGPLIVWLIKKDSSTFIDGEGKSAMNFQLTVLIANCVLLILGIILSFICIGIVFFILMGVVFIVTYVYAVIAGISANEGKPYSYPYSMKFFK